MSDPSPRGVTAQEFFAAGLPGVTLTDAHHATRIAYSTIHRASKGGGIHANSARELEAWSRGLGLPVFISAAATLGLAGVEDLTPTATDRGAA